MSRDHGGGLDAAVTRFGGNRETWLDLSTGINPQPYPVGAVSSTSWTQLPDAEAFAGLLSAARAFWGVPSGAEVIAAPGASALIARFPDMTEARSVHIPTPTYNEHAAAFTSAGVQLEGPDAPVHVYVHPNNPDGRVWNDIQMGVRDLTIIDESFCDVIPEQSHVQHCTKAGVVVLKSFGKFWGLAGLRLGFVIAAPETLQRMRGLTELLGPWAVSGPALEIGRRALLDLAWAHQTRSQLAADAAKLDGLLTGKGATLIGGTSLFRLYSVDDAANWQDRLARSQIWSRIFPYSTTWLRLGLPPKDGWARLEAAL